MKICAMILTAAASLSMTAFAIDHTDQSYNSIGSSNDTSLVILETDAGILDSNSEYYSGTYTNRHNRVELVISRTGRVASNIVIRSDGLEFPVNFNERLAESRSGFVTDGFYTVGYLTSAGTIYCNFPVSLALNFFEEGAVAEAELEYPTFAGLSSFGQCIHGQMKNEFFEVERQAQ
jgi:hypothetical protein